MKPAELTDIAAELITALKAKGYTAASAESCTGGNIARSITSVPGASEVFAGSIVAYSNDVKHRLLGVDPPTLQHHGAVSQPTVTEMASGARTAIGTDCAVATSGIAGPGGGSVDKPVGTVWMAVDTPSTKHAALYHFNGTRSEIIDQATVTAIKLLIESI
ncbi:MAG: CinA family protein [Muribaculaceae bacterium]|nr:CinA family protein [Muribaculaceae bacterium]